MFAWTVTTYVRRLAHNFHDSSKEENFPRMAMASVLKLRYISNLYIQSGCRDFKPFADNNCSLVYIHFLCLWLHYGSVVTFLQVYQTSKITKSLPYFNFMKSKCYALKSNKVISWLTIKVCFLQNVLWKDGSDYIRYSKM